MLKTKLKILIIDNDKEDRLMIRRALNLSNYNADICAATDIESGILLLSEEFFECIFLDYNLPGSNGFQFLKQYISAGGHAPVIMLTLKEDEKFYFESIKNGATDYLAKNLITTESVTQVLKKALRKKNPKNSLPVFAMTVYTSGDRKNKDLNAEMNYEVSKPFEVTNLSYLREISENNESFFKDFINLFLQNAPQSIVDLETALAKKDWEGVRQAAHKIKPSLSYLGMKEVHQAAATVEEFAKERIKLDEIPDLVKNIKDTCKQAYSELEKEIKETFIN